MRCVCSNAKFLILLCMVATGCARFGFDPLLSEAGEPDATPEGLGVDAPGAGDGASLPPRDSALSDLAGHIAAPDGGVHAVHDATRSDARPDLSGPEAALDGTASDLALPPAKLVVVAAPRALPCTGGIEPAIRTDGLTLVTRVGGASQVVVNTRPAVGQDFDGCRTIPTRPTQDATYFDYLGQERAIVPVQGARSIRHLEYCASAAVGSCDTIVIRDLSGAVITADTDGPSVADAVSPLQMVFNTGNTIHLAEPTSSDLLAWQVRETLPISGDDPAITPDASLVLYGTAPSIIPSEIRALYRTTATGWSAPHHLATFDTEMGSLEPEIFAVSNASPPTYEVFYRSGTTPYQATVER